MPQPLEVRDFFGARFEMSPQEFVQILRQPATQTYLVLSYILMVATDAPNLLGAMSLGTLMGLWLVVLAVFHLMLWLCLTAATWLQGSFRSFALYRTVWFQIATLATLLVGKAMIEFTTGGQRSLQLYPHALFYCVVAEAFGFMFFNLILPNVARDAPQDPERHVIVGAEPVPLARIQTIEAREHHVHITLDGDSLTHRARLSDIIAQTHPEDGVQPHRSWWIAAQMAEKLERDGAKHVLHLKDGNRVPVARSRVGEVRTWLDQRA
ncbi:LytTR family DNA-binding domain-containing protein [Tropicibacter naphthalenivorans]|uniref:LytTR family DNA-binding domain-containing protein n=1 Tax=Tropicibacter naphthalenivorans TaxID=441103 RepID=UPI00071D10F8|nr:LytTR family DNA-binding domain-containing protein [Tropicibacter naphthalenivorans]